MKTPYELYLEKEAANALGRRIQSGQLSDHSLKRVGVSQDQIQAYRNPNTNVAQKADATKSVMQTAKYNTLDTGPKNIGAQSGFSTANMHGPIDPPKPMKPGFKIGPKGLGAAAVGAALIGGGLKLWNGMRKAPAAPAIGESISQSISKLKPMHAVGIGAGVGVGTGVVAGNMMSDKSASQEEGYMDTPYDLYMDMAKEAAKTINPNDPLYSKLQGARSNVGPQVASRHEGTGRVQTASSKEQAEAAKRIAKYRTTQKADRAVKTVSNAVNTAGSTVTEAIQHGKNLVGGVMGVAGAAAGHANTIVNELGGVENIKNVVNKVKNVVAPPPPPTFGQQVGSFFKANGGHIGKGLALGGGAAAIGLGGLALGRAMTQSGPSTPSTEQY